LFGLGALAGTEDLHFHIVNIEMAPAIPDVPEVEMEPWN
jgi:hypothetical protein